MENEPRKENEGGEESECFLLISFNISPTSLIHSIDDRVDGRENRNDEKRVQSIRLSDDVELKRHLREGFNPHLHQSEEVCDEFHVSRFAGFAGVYKVERLLISSPPLIFDFDPAPGGKIV